MEVKLCLSVMLGQEQSEDGREYSAEKDTVTHEGRRNKGLEKTALVIISMIYIVHQILFG